MAVTSKPATLTLVGFLGGYIAAKCIISDGPQVLKATNLATASMMTTSATSICRIYDSGPLAAQSATEYLAVSVYHAVLWYCSRVRKSRSRQGHYNLQKHAGQPDTVIKTACEALLHLLSSGLTDTQLERAGEVLALNDIMSPCTGTCQQGNMLSWNLC